MRRSRLPLRSLALLAGLALFATACGGGDDAASGGDAAADPQSVEGTVTWWDTSDATNEAPKFQELIKEFEAEFPKIKVEYVNVPFSEAQNKFKTAAQSGSGAPDVIRAEVAWVPEFASLGYLQPLDGTPALEGSDDYLEGPLGSTKYDGKTWAIPQVTDALALLYNKQLVQQAGLDPAQAPATFADLKTAALQVKQKVPGVDGIYVNPGGYFLMPFIYGEGGDLLDVEQQKITVNDPPAVAGLNVALDLYTSGAAAKPNLTDGYNDMQARFKDGKVAMVINGPWSVADNLSGKAFTDPENLGIAAVPAGASGTVGSPVGGHDYAIYAGSDAIDASYIFIEWMNRAENQAFLAKELGLLPTRASAYDLPDAQANPVVPQFKTVLESATTRPAIPAGGQLFVPLDENFVRAISGDETAQSALDAVAAEYQKVAGLEEWQD